MNTYPAMKGTLMLSCSRVEKAWTAAMTSKPASTARLRVVFPDSRVAKQNQQFVAARLVNVTVVTSHRAGAAAPETLERIAPEGIA